MYILPKLPQSFAMKRPDNNSFLSCLDPLPQSSSPSRDKVGPGSVKLSSLLTKVSKGPQDFCSRGLMSNLPGAHCKAIRVLFLRVPGLLCWSPIAGSDVSSVCLHKGVCVSFPPTSYFVLNKLKGVACK